MTDKVQIQRESDTPLVSQVASAIEQIIRSHEIGHDQAIPSERLLASELGVSRTTVRAAITLLIDRQQLYRIPGSGTYVNDLLTNARGGNRPISATQIIALSLIELSNPWFVELARGLQQALYAQEYDCLLNIADYSVEQEQAFMLRLCQRQHVRGLLIAPAREENQRVAAYEQLRDANIPFVFVSHHIDEIDADYVVVDGYAGAYDAVSYLIRLGHQHIGYVCCDTPVVGATSRTRKQGYIQAMLDHNLTPLPTSDFVDIRQNIGSGFRAMSELLAHSIRPTAILAFNDSMAIGAFHRAQEEGIHVPEELSIIGIDNTEMGAILAVPLTSVDPAPDVLGKLAVNILLNRIEYPDEIRYQKVAVRPNLILRSSCAPPSS